MVENIDSITICPLLSDKVHLQLCLENCAFKMGDECCIPILTGALLEIKNNIN